jgi:uncharacterized phage-associated protein
MTPIQCAARGQERMLQLAGVCNRNPETIVLCHSNYLYCHAATASVLGGEWLAKQNELLKAIGGGAGLYRLAAANQIDLHDCAASLTNRSAARSSPRDLLKNLRFPMLVNYLSHRWFFLFVQCDMIRYRCFPEDTSRKFSDWENNMATVLDVAQYILEQAGEMTAMKLQKLAFYSQAWSLVWEDEPLFENRFEAWANGPVSPTLYQHHKGMFRVNANAAFGNSAALSAIQKETIDRVLDVLKDKTGLWLSELTHSEAPWLNARGDAAPTDRLNTVIPLDAMYEYYASL